MIGSHQILGQAIAVKKALEREQKEAIAAGASVRGRGAYYSFACIVMKKADSLNSLSLCESGTHPFTIYLKICLMIIIRSIASQS